MVETKIEKATKDTKEEAKIVKETKKIILRNVKGEDMQPENYFYKGVVLPSFQSICGMPVEREELISVFNKVFKPEDNILFYRAIDKEVYIIIIPLKYSSTVGEENNSVEGDFQKHAISFINEGSVNVDTLKKKLMRIVPFVKYTDR